MLKYIYLIFLAFFLLACSENASNNPSSDTKFLSITRAPSATGVDITSLLAIGFSNDLNISSLISSTQISENPLAPSYPIDANSSIYLSNANGDVVPASITIDDTNYSKVLIEPNIYLTPSSTYNIVVTTSLQDINGSSLSADSNVSFTTDSNTSDPIKSLNFVDINPIDTSTTDTNITSVSIGFDGDIAKSELPIFSLTDTNTSTLVNGLFTYFNSKVTFTTLPLTPGHIYDVNMTNPPTDMYGNKYDTATTEMNWSFTVSDSLSASTGPSPSFLYDTNNTTAYMIETFSNTDNNATLIAVARAGGVDIYRIDPNSSTLFVKDANITIASEIRDMKFINNTTNYSNNLLIATKSDGIFLVDVNTTSGVVNKYNYLNTTGEIYGVGYGKDGNLNVDRIYAVGPDIGMVVLDATGGDSNLTTLATIQIGGRPLKVSGFNSGNTRKTFVSDYDKGLLVYDENGTDITTLSSVSGKDIKYIEYIDTGSNSFMLKLISNIGNIYEINPDSITSGFSATPSYSYSIDGDIVDVTKSYNGLVVATKKGFYETGIVFSPLLIDEVRSVAFSYNDFYYIVLGSSGKIYLYAYQ